MNAKHTPAANTKLSPELLAALRQWDDTDADTLAVSKERLAVFGSNASEQLAAFLHRRVQFSRVGVGVFFVNFALLYAVVCVWSLYHVPRQPFPVVINTLLLGLSGVGIASVLAAVQALEQAKVRHAAKALAEINPVLAVDFFTQTGVCFSSVQSSRSVHLKLPLLTALQHLLAWDGQPPISLSEKQWRILRRLISAIEYSDLRVAVIRFFAKMENDSAVPQARDVATHSRVWEVREAAEEYLERFAPEEARNPPSPKLLPDSQVEADVTEEDAILSRVMGIGSRNSAERQAAQTALHNINKTQLELILRLLGQEPDGNQRAGHAISYGCILAGVAVGSLTYLPCIHSPWYDMRMALTVSCVCAIAGGTLGWLIGANINYGRRNRMRARMLGCVGGVFPEMRLLEALAELENPALLGTLIAWLPSGSNFFTSNSHIGKSLQKAVTRLLPRLQASDTSLLDDTARSLLNQQLGRGRRTLSGKWAGTREAEQLADYDVAILKAWEQVGDERALPYVEKLAELSAASAAQKRVQQAAWECLPYLQARADHQRIAQTLLRAAQSPAEPGDILLRAAAPSVAPVETEQLLRAAQE